MFITYLIQVVLQICNGPSCFNYIELVGLCLCSNWRSGLALLHQLIALGFNRFRWKNWFRTPGPGNELISPNNPSHKFLMKLDNHGLQHSDLRFPDTKGCMPRPCYSWGLVQPSLLSGVFLVRDTKCVPMQRSLVAWVLAQSWTGAQTGQEQTNRCLFSISWFSWSGFSHETHMHAIEFEGKRLWSNHDHHGCHRPLHEGCRSGISRSAQPGC